MGTATKNAKSTKTSGDEVPAKADSGKEPKRIGNEAQMLAMVRANKSDAAIKKEFTARYAEKGVDAAFIERRISVYRKIAERALEAEQGES
jgi:hypothetical protein